VLAGSVFAASVLAGSVRGGRVSVGSVARGALVGGALVVAAESALDEAGGLVEVVVCAARAVLHPAIASVATVHQAARRRMRRCAAGGW